MTRRLRLRLLAGVGLAAALSAGQVCAFAFAGGSTSPTDTVTTTAPVTTVVAPTTTAPSVTPDAPPPPKEAEAEAHDDQSDTHRSGEDDRHAVGSYDDRHDPGGQHHPHDDADACRDHERHQDAGELVQVGGEARARGAALPGRPVEEDQGRAAEEALHGHPEADVSTHARRWRRASAHADQAFRLPPPGEPHVRQLLRHVRARVGRHAHRDMHASQSQSPEGQVHQAVPARRPRGHRHRPQRRSFSAASTTTGR